MSSEISEVTAGQVNERFLEVPTNSTYFADLATLNAAQSGAQNPFDAVVREVVDLRAASGDMSAFDSRYVSKSTEDSVHIVGAGEMLVAFGSAVYQRVVTYYGTWALDAAATEALTFNTMLPQHWATYHADIMTLNTTAGSGDIRWTFHRSIVANGATMSGLNTSVTVAVGAQNALTYQRVLTGASNTSGSGIFCYFERDAAAPADTFASDINVVGVVFTRAS